jgi:hypothetical protein
MAGDYTRDTFDPFKLFSGLHKQQGRVSLDSEFNEFENILDRRDRAEMYDVWGLWGEAIIPLTTPNGFQIAVNGAGQLTIGIGRAYVDGILAECFGDISNPLTTVRDDHLGGIDGSGPVIYEQQPFFYQPAFPALSATPAVINLVYLDVWQREVTVFEDNRLREPALNGPDTATRVQTAWQVKILQDADASSCTTPPPSWTTLTAPSTARMTALAAPAAPAPGPCIINPAGGYTGLENRLYRVEVHTAGTLTGAGGTTRAQFKWSRDNASLAARVLSITPSGPQSVITVTSTGRDSWMRFEPGHHIELLDDYVEYAMRETGTGGPMARVVTVNHATGEITIDQNLSAFPIVPARHPRIRRWDIATAAEPLVRDTGNGVALPLEEGITVAFGGNNADTLHAGDYWVFAARTADGSIDPVNNMPPRGILHHFARLALVTSGTPPVVLSDCRNKPKQGAGCCTVVVQPGESIQAAINSLPPEGGCICLKAGVHNITSTILIDRSNVHLHGESEGAEIHSQALGETIHIGGAAAGVHDVMVEHVRIIVASTGTGGGAVFGIENATRVTLRENEISVTTIVMFPDFYIGVIADESTDVVIANNTFDHLFYGALIDDVAERLWIIDNQFTGILYNATGFSASFGVLGVYLGSNLAGDHRVERNVFHHFMTGIQTSLGSQGGTIATNRILRSGGPSTGTVPSSTAELRTYLDSKLYAIELLGGPCDVRENYIELDSADWGGIRIRTERASVTSNTITGNVPESQLLVPSAIYCTVNTETGQAGNFSTISDNILRGPLTGIVASRVAGVSVCDNQVDGLFHGWFGVRLDDCSYTTVADNHIASVGFGFAFSEGDHNVVRGCRMAFTLTNCTTLMESDLTICDCEFIGGSFGAILVLYAGGDVLISGNRIANCGWLALPPVQGSIFVLMLPLVEQATTGSLRIDSCEILESGVSPDGATTATGAVRGIHAWVPNCQIVNNRVVSTHPKLIGSTDEHRALLMLGPVSYEPLRIGVSSAVVANNVFRGPGETSLVQFFRFDLPIGDNVLAWEFHKIAFNGNFCEHYATEGGNKATVLLSGFHALASGNQVTAERGVPSIDVRGDRAASVVGNITTGDIRDTAVPLEKPAPRGDFNVINLP